MGGAPCGGRFGRLVTSGRTLKISLVVERRTKGVMWVCPMASTPLGVVKPLVPAHFAVAWRRVVGGGWPGWSVTGGGGHTPEGVSKMTCILVSGFAGSSPGRDPEGIPRDDPIVRKPRPRAPPSSRSLESAHEQSNRREQEPAAGARDGDGGHDVPRRTGNASSGAPVLCPGRGAGHVESLALHADVDRLPHHAAGWWRQSDGDLHGQEHLVRHHLVLQGQQQPLRDLADGDDGEHLLPGRLLHEAGTDRDLHMYRLCEPDEGHQGHLRLRDPEGDPLNCDRDRQGHHRHGHQQPARL